MEYLVIHNNEQIGKVVEPEADRGMGVVIGQFVPFRAYEDVRPVYRMYTKLVNGGLVNQEHLDRYYYERDALHISITTMAGIAVKTLWIDIYDFSEELEDRQYEVHFCVACPDGGFFDDPSLWYSDVLQVPFDDLAPLETLDQDFLAAQTSSLNEMCFERSDGTLLSVFVHNDRAWLYFCQDEDDDGFSSWNPLYTGSEEATFPYVISNG